MADFYSVQGTLQNEEQDHKRASGRLLMGRSRVATVQYTTAGTEVNGDLIYIARFPHPVVIDPTLSTIAIGATLDGAAVTLDIGDDPGWTSPTPVIDRYADAIIVTGPGVVKWDSVATGATDQVYSPYTTIQGGWLVATINASSALNASIVLTFRVHYAIN